MLSVRGGLGLEAVPTAAFVDAWVCAASSRGVEAVEEFTDRAVPLLGVCGGGKIPQGR